jgi:GNAT superfamily N-acetyltransferase
VRDFEEICAIEALAANAWPAETVQRLDGWRLRMSGSVYRRLDSVATIAPRGALPVERKLTLAERFYFDRGSDARFQVSAASAPSDLDARLEARGYAIDAPTRVQKARLGDVLARTAGGRDFEVRVTDAPEPIWITTAWPKPGRRRDAGRRALARIVPPAGHALVRAAGQPIAVGLGVLERGFLGLFAMLTQPEFRGRGAARAVLHALSRWGAQRGAERAYLQVEEANAVAGALYRDAGFVTLYEYHYRSRGPATSDRRHSGAPT